MTTTEKPLSEMSGPELVAHYNRMAESDLGKELGAKPTQKFKDLATGIKRIESLASSIRAREDGLAAAEKQKGGPAAKEVEPAPKKKAKQEPAPASAKAATPKKKAEPNGEDKEANLRVKIVSEKNPRRDGTGAHKRFEEMRRFLEKHPKATKAEVIAGTDYTAIDMAWDVQRKDVSLG